MLAGDASFFSDPAKTADFLYAICVQFTRTKRARQAAIRVLGSRRATFDAARIWDMAGHIVASSVGQSLYADRHNFRIVLLHDGTQTPFITADQPIINFRCDNDDNPPEKLGFYYPLSPTRAMLYVEAPNADSYEPRVGDVAANNFNIMMMRHSYEQVYSNSSDYLEVMRKCDK
jgi:hypothetical protein